MGGWPIPGPGRLLPGKRPDTDCTGGWVSPTADLDGCGKSHETGMSVARSSK